MGGTSKSLLEIKIGGEPVEVDDSSVLFSKKFNHSMVSYLKSVTSIKVMITKVNFHQTEENLTISDIFTYMYI